MALNHDKHDKLGKENIHSLAQLKLVPFLFNHTQRIEDEQNRHSTGFLRDHARSVDLERQHYERHRE